MFQISGYLLIILISQLEQNTRYYVTTHADFLIAYSL